MAQRMERTDSSAVTEKKEDEQSPRSSEQKPATETPAASATFRPAAASTPPRTEPAPMPPPAAAAGKPVVLVGFDLGTNVSAVQACERDGTDIPLSIDLLPTVVGYAKDGILPSILPRGETTLYGEEALKFKLHLNLRWPLEHGCVKDMRTARDFAAYVKQAVVGSRDCSLWAVAGVPANAPVARQKDTRAALADAFDRLLMVPEPFLAAMGYRDDARIGSEDYDDPIRNSLFVDIGAGTTDLCVIQGYYPAAENQISLPKGGDDIDLTLLNLARKKYPDASFSTVRIRKIKEEGSFVGEPRDRVIVTHLVNGKPRKLDLTGEIGRACGLFIEEVVADIAELVARSDTDAVDELLRNIILTGGGSLIRGIREYFENLLHGEGLVDARVKLVDDYKRLVAKGALKIAKKVKDDQWQIPV